MENKHDEIVDNILDTDSYKSGMFLQYPPNTHKVFQYLESRGCDRGYENTVFFGLQRLLKKYFCQPITMDAVEEANEILTAHGEPFPLNSWRSIVTDRGGKLPLRIRAVPEGSVIPLHNVLMTVENTAPQYYWVPTWFETQLVRMWYPITVATQSYYLKQLIYKYLVETSDDPDAEIGLKLYLGTFPENEVNFKLHDFGSRGVSSRETAKIGGGAHLTSFLGTDTVIALPDLRRNYHETMGGYSIPAAEHSTITSWGKEHEVDAFRNMLKQFAKPGSLVAIVSDSWDIYNAAEKLWGDVLKQEVIDSGATVVIRPDSGVPHEVDLKVAQILADKFGYSVNSKGYKVLNNVRIIQGDGVDYQSIPKVLDTLKANGFSATNIAFGSGGGLLQKLNRDTMQFAFKCSAIWVGDELREVYKQPVTSSAKNSKRGVLDLVRDETGYHTVKRPFGWKDRIVSELVTYFEDGEVLVDDTLANIRARIATSLPSK